MAEHGLSQPPEGAVEAGIAEICCRLGWFAPHVSAIEPASVPATRQAPQRGVVHDVATLVRGAGKPPLNARLTAENSLMRTGVHNVVPHVGDRHQEVSYLRAARRLVATDDPSMWGVAGWAAGGDEHVGFAVDEMRRQLPSMCERCCVPACITS